MRTDCAKNTVDITLLVVLNFVAASTKIFTSLWRASALLRRHRLSEEGILEARQIEATFSFAEIMLCRKVGVAELQ